MGHHNVASYASVRSLCYRNVVVSLVNVDAEDYLFLALVIEVVLGFVVFVVIGTINR
jgi:hypothetical protein